MEGSKEKKEKQRVHYIRLLTLACLLGTAAGFAYGSYYIVYFFEAKLEAEEFSSLAEQLETSTLRSMGQKVEALQTAAEILSLMCPDPDVWPNCSVPMKPFLNYTDPLIKMGELRTLAFAPIITPAMVTEFEAFAYEMYERNGYPDLGISSFGKGISAVNTTTGGRYHDTQGPSLNNQFQILTPVIQIGNLIENRPAAMFNLYSQEFRISAIDFMINCFNAGGRGSRCVSITDIIHLVQDPVFRPAVLIIHPVSADQDYNRLVGLNYGVLNWDTVLSNIIPAFVDGIEVVLSGGENSYTFAINEGLATLKGVGDLHDDQYDDSAESFSVPYYAGSVIYSLTMYPTDHYAARFHSMLPVYALLIAIGIVLLTSAIFLVYDFKMKREVRAREIVMNTKRLFVRFISHEIRTPMNIVHLGLKLLTKEIRTYISSVADTESGSSGAAIAKLEEWVKLAAEIEESSDAAILVLNDLINYDKISLGGMTIENEPLNMWQILENTIKPFSVQAREKNTTIKIDIEVKRPSLSLQRKKQLWMLRLIGDSIKIAQVIRNLVSNALKFTSDGEVEITAVFIENGLPLAKMSHFEKDFSFTKTGSLLISVKDSGAGISEEDQLSLFKEGIQFRANQLQAGGGSGLGLWISKGVVDLHHGTLRAFSAGEGKGTTFFLEVPVGYVMMSSLAEDLEELSEFEIDDLVGELEVGNRKAVYAHDKSLRALTDYESASESSAYRQARTILCVDDSGSSRKITCRMLEHCGYICYQACDGEDCLEVFKSLTHDGVIIDFVLMDFEMPKMNGPTATKNLIQMGCTCPIIGVTGNVLQADRDVFLHHGAMEVLAKPLSVDLLEKLFAKLLLKSASGVDTVRGSAGDNTPKLDHVAAEQKRQSSYISLSKLSSSFGMQEQAI